MSGTRPTATCCAKRPACAPSLRTPWRKLHYPHSSAGQRGGRRPLPASSCARGRARRGGAPLAIFWMAM
eukprot:5809211-Alexandrium_andersonii.AAC.1